MYKGMCVAHRDVCGSLGMCVGSSMVAHLAAVAATRVRTTRHPTKYCKYKKKFKPEPGDKKSIKKSFSL